MKELKYKALRSCATYLSDKQVAQLRSAINQEDVANLWLRIAKLCLPQATESLDSYAVVCRYRGYEH